MQNDQGAAEAEKDVSLLMMTMDRLAQAERPLEPTNRIIVLGKLAEGTTAEMFVAMHEQTLGEDVTGLLLMLPSGFAEIVEGPLVALRSVLRVLSNKGVVENGKVAGFTEDVPTRSFSCWSSKALDVQRSNFVELSGKGEAGEVEVAGKRLHSIVAVEVEGTRALCRNYREEHLREAFALRLRFFVFLGAVRISGNRK